MCCCPHGEPANFGLHPVPSLLPLPGAAGPERGWVQPHRRPLLRAWGPTASSPQRRARHSPSTHTHWPWPQLRACLPAASGCCPVSPRSTVPTTPRHQCKNHKPDTVQGPRKQTRVSYSLQASCLQSTPPPRPAALPHQAPGSPPCCSTGPGGPSTVSCPETPERGLSRGSHANAAGQLCPPHRQRQSPARCPRQPCSARSCTQPVPSVPRQRPSASAQPCHGSSLLNLSENTGLIN